MDEHNPLHEEGADDLLRRALIDEGASAAVALKVRGLPLSDELTVVFHGRQDLGTIQTYITPGRRGAGAAVSAGELLRVPCDLDLAEAEDRRGAEELYVAQARALRDAIEAADTVLAVWREPLEDLAHAHVAVDHVVRLDVQLPAHRLLPTTLRASDRNIVVTAVCGARRLAEGLPPMGIACAAGDLSRVYPLPDDPERCLEDFFALAADHARRTAEQLLRQEASVRRFLEISGEELPETA